MTSSTSRSGGSTWGLLVLLTVVVTIAVTGCQGSPPVRKGVPVSSGFPVPTSSGEGPRPSYSPTVGPTRLGSRTLPGGGRVLTDSRGLTVYATDSVPASQVVSRCKGVCTNIWRPLVVGSASVRSKVAGVPGETFGTLPLPGGLHQLTTNGRRVYTFVVDKLPGQTRGQHFLTGTTTGDVYTWSVIVLPSTAPATIPLER
ncbi:hypothetical protein SAMN05421678_12753 [Actinopolymorpha cephalotaxi]|uniref:Lipoprotein n=1 Tax=Actinopolymorpha cephalotaxi TaxID=504797 RepID=A0A1I3BYH5_9ACTN|nr:hypothetical protein SAMN05421678_12753 [Actinopolymorpha cephalotaxi]